ncbi:MAG TPA: hypothetical protein VKR59_07735 [Terriglobales bacterium]|nr:hypothetical protein [Terriglobales bacterium]
MAQLFHKFELTSSVATTHCACYKSEMPYPLKSVSQVQIEEALAKALGELTGRKFTVNIRSMEAIGNDSFKDRNGLNLVVESDYSLMEKWREERIAGVQEENATA